MTSLILAPPQTESPCWLLDCAGGPSIRPNVKREKEKRGKKREKTKREKNKR